MAVNFKGAHFPQEIILTGVRWYVAYPLSTRPVEALLCERGVHVDHATINRWVVTDSPPMEEAFHRRKRSVWVSWRMEQDHRAVKRITRPMLGFTSFAAAPCTLAGVELMPMLKKTQRVVADREEGLTAAEQFSSLAA
jgi:transposase-like protein